MNSKKPVKTAKLDIGISGLDRARIARGLSGLLADVADGIFLTEQAHHCELRVEALPDVVGNPAPHGRYILLHPGLLDAHEGLLALASSDAGSKPGLRVRNSGGTVKVCPVALAIDGILFRPETARTCRPKYQMLPPSIARPMML